MVPLTKRALLLVLLIVLAGVAFSPSAGAVDKANIGPGYKMSPDAAGTLSCTFTAVGHDKFGTLVALIARHCAGSYDVYLTDRLDLGPVGRFVTLGPPPKASFPSYDSSLDYAVIALDASKVNPVNRSPNGLTVDHIGTPVAPFRSWVCKDGRTSGVTCGPVTQSSGNIIRTWNLVMPGDSGGPLVLGTGLVGIVSAYNYFNPLGPFQFVDIRGVLADLNARNAPGAGFVPIH